MVAEELARGWDPNARHGAESAGARRLLPFPPHQRHRHVAHDLQARGAHLVDRVVLGVPRGIVEVHDVDGSDAGLLQLQVIVDQRVLGVAMKVPA